MEASWEGRPMPQNRPTGGRLLRRRFTLGSGPLKRTSDHLQFLARVLLVCTLLTAIPIALATATATYTQARIQGDAQAADRHRISAKLVVDETIPTREEWTASDTERKTAAWTDPAGIERRAAVYVLPGTKVGSTVPIWVDSAGRRTTEPLSAEDAAGRAVANGLMTFAVLALVAYGAFRSVCTLLDRS